MHEALSRIPRSSSVVELCFGGRNIVFHNLNFSFLFFIFPTKKDEFSFSMIWINSADLSKIKKLAQ